MKFDLNKLILLTNNALFDEDFTVGQEGLIAGLKDNVGVIVCYVISAIGFIIVAAAIIKNALAGLYLAYPKLWDKVHTVRQQMEDGFKNQATGGEKWKKVTGSVMMILISALPDVKDATEFGEDENGQNSKATSSFEKKQWLLKAIPEFLALVMIGMLIYYGYPTKLANWVGETGRFALDAFFDNVDPVQLTKNVFDGLATYELATDSATSSSERNVNGIVRSAVKQMYTRYSDMHQQPLQQTATLLEQDILADFASVVELATVLEEPDGLTVSYAVQLTSTSPVINKAFTEVQPVEGAALTGKMYSATSTSGVRQFKYYIKASTYPTGSTKVGELDYLLITVNATPKSQTVVNAAKVSIATGMPDLSGTPIKFVISNVNFNITNGVYVISGAPVTVNVYGGSNPGQFSGTISVEGTQAWITMSSTVAQRFCTAASTCTYVDVLLPEKSYTLYTQTGEGGAEITSKLNMLAIRMQKDVETPVWLNAAWSDYNTGTTGGYKAIGTELFESTESTSAPAS